MPQKGELGVAVPATVPYRPTLGAAVRRARSYGWLAGYVGASLLACIAALSFLFSLSGGLFDYQLAIGWVVAIVLLILLPAHLILLALGWVTLGLYRRYFAAGWPPAAQGGLAAVTVFAALGGFVYGVFLA